MHHKIMRIFVASPADVAKERACAKKVVSEFNDTWSNSLKITFQTIQWETHTHPDIGEYAQAVINDQINDSYEIFIGIFWSRIGTPTPSFRSGTVEEFHRALKRYQRGDLLHISCYFKTRPISPDKVVPDQIKAIQSFQEELQQSNVFYWQFKSLNDFERDLRSHLSQMAIAHSELIAHPSLLSSDSAETLTDGNLEVTWNELLEINNDSTIIVVESLTRITKAANDVTLSLFEVNSEISQLDQIKDPQNFIDVRNSIISRLNGILSDYANKCIVESQVISRAMRLMIESISGMIRFGKEFTNLQDYNLEIKYLHSRIAEFKKSLSSSIGNVSLFESSMAILSATIPPVRSSVSEAVSAVKMLGQAFENALEQVSILERLVEEHIG
ncbi:hypothetical protein [Lacunimicrobium album]